MTTRQRAAYVKAISQALKSKDRKAIAEHLSAYRDLLAEHIKKEDEILYPWIDRGLSTRQVGELFAKFDEAEEGMDKGVVDRCEKFALEAGERVQKMGRKKEEVKWATWKWADAPVQGCRISERTQRAGKKKAGRASRS